MLDYQTFRDNKVFEEKTRIFLKEAFLWRWRDVKVFQKTGFSLTAINRLIDALLRRAQSQECLSLQPF